MNKTCTVYRYWGVYVIIGVASKMSTPTKPGLGVRSGPVFPCVGIRFLVQRDACFWGQILALQQVRIHVPEIFI